MPDKAATMAPQMPTGRASPEEIQQLTHLAYEDTIVKVLLEASQGYLLILDGHRQILAGNQEFLEALQFDSPDHFVGSRMGEALNCLFSNVGPDGCGTSTHCPSCGAMIAITSSQAFQKNSVGECRLSMKSQGKFEARDFRVRASPITLSGHRLISVVITDISACKRREILEQVFVHDLLNTVGGLSGLAEILGPETPKDEKKLLVALSERLQSEVNFHRDLIAGEKGTLLVEYAPIRVSKIFNTLKSIFEHHKAATGKKLTLIPPPLNAEIVIDEGLLLKILVNMVKNAFEAIPIGETVSIRFEEPDRASGFVVQNPGLIPVDVQRNIFERSFTTKNSPGRGIGTYSMKLFGERYLGGKVGFSSSSTDGTIFSIFFPTHIPAISLTPAPQASLSIEAKPLGKGSPPPGTSEKLNILVIEDDDSVLHLEQLLLERLGHKVFPFEGPLKALETFLLSPDSFDLVMTDYSMTPFNGTKLAIKIREVRPDIPIILSTEFSEPITMEDAKAAGFLKVLRKPFTSRELGETIQQIRLILKKRSL